MEKIIVTKLKVKKGKLTKNKLMEHFIKSCMYQIPDILYAEAFEKDSTPKFLSEAKKLVESYGTCEEFSVCVNTGEGRLINIPGLEGLADLTFLETMLEIKPSSLQILPDKPGYATIMVTSDTIPGCSDLTVEKGSKQYLSSGLLQKFEIVLNHQYMIYKKKSQATVNPAISSAINKPLKLPLLIRCSELDVVETIVPAIKCRIIPVELIGSWISRVKERFGEYAIETFVKEWIKVGFHLVPRSTTSHSSDIEWRISFSAMEELVCAEWKLAQWECFHLVRTLLRTHLNIPFVVTSHNVKTLMLWAVEVKPPEIWDRGANYCVVEILQDFIHALSCHELPNYFMPNQNLLESLPKVLLSTTARMLHEIKEVEKWKLQGVLYCYSLKNHVSLHRLHLLCSTDPNRAEMTLTLATTVTEILIDTANVAIMDANVGSQSKLANYQKEVLFHACSYLGFVLVLFVSQYHRTKGKDEILVTGSSNHTSRALEHSIKVAYLDLVILVTNFLDSLAQYSLSETERFYENTNQTNSLAYAIKVLSRGMRTVMEYHISEWERVYSQYKAVFPKFFTMSLREIADAEPLCLHNRIWNHVVCEDMIDRHLTGETYKPSFVTRPPLVSQNGLDIVSGVDIANLDRLLNSQFKHVKDSYILRQYKLKSFSADEDVLLSGGQAEGSYVSSDSFIKEPGVQMSSDLDIMRPLIEMKGKWDFVNQLPNSPGFVQLDVTSFKTENVKSFIIYKEERKFLSGTRAKKFLEAKLKSDCQGCTIAANSNYPTRAALRWFGRTFPKGFSDDDEDPLYERPVEIDEVPAIFFENWPQCANQWPFRVFKRLDSSLVFKVIQSGHQLVPKCRPGGDVDTEWRVSFSVAEAILIQSWTWKQLSCLCVGKIMLQKYLDMPDDVVTTYHFKTVMFWACEQKSPEVWSSCSLAQCLLGVFGDLIHALSSGILPHYFIHRLNLLDLTSMKSLQEANRQMSKLRNNVTKCIETKQLSQDMIGTTSRLIKFCIPCTSTTSLDKIQNSFSLIAKVAAFHCLLMYADQHISQIGVQTAETLLNAYLCVCKLHFHFTSRKLSSLVTTKQDNDKYYFKSPNAKRAKLSDDNTPNIILQSTAVFREMAAVGETFICTLCRELGTLNDHGPLEKEQLYMHFIEKISGNSASTTEAKKYFIENWLNISDIVTAENLLPPTPDKDTGDINIAKMLQSPTNEDEEPTLDGFEMFDFIVGAYLRRIPPQYSVIFDIILSHLLDETVTEIPDDLQTIPGFKHLPDIYDKYVSKKKERKVFKKDHVKRLKINVWNQDETQTIISQEAVQEFLEFRLFFLDTVLDPVGRKKYFFHIIHNIISSLNPTVKNDETL